jgi:predicted HicB family RNase H-like nuclease
MTTPPKPKPLGTLKDGTVLTEELADELAEEAERGYDLSLGRRVGRPSLGRGQSPRINIRLTQQLHDRALERAQREGKTLSELAREALERHVG